MIEYVFSRHVRNCDSCFSGGYRFAGSFMRLFGNFGIQIVVSFRVTKKQQYVRKDPLIRRMCSVDSLGVTPTRGDVILQRKQIANCIFMSSLFCRVVLSNNGIWL